MYVYIVIPRRFFETWLSLTLRTFDRVIDVANVAIKSTDISAEERTAWTNQKRMFAPIQKPRPKRKTFTAKTVARRQWTGPQKVKKVKS